MMVSKNIEPIDIVTVLEFMRGAGFGGKAENTIDEMTLVDISNSATTPNLTYHCKKIKEAAKLRGVIQICADAQENAFSGELDADEVLGPLQTKLFEIDSGNTDSGPIRVGEILPSVFSTIEGITTGNSIGISTGFVDLDKITTGLQPTEYTILAARPSMGKTALALQIAMNAAKSGHTSLIFSLEMGKDQLVLRELCSQAKVSMHRLRSGILPKHDFPKLSNAASSISDATAWVDDTPAITPIKMMSRAKRIKKLYGLDLIVVDYLQLCRWHERSQSREQEIAKISASMKTLAKESGCHVIALSQLSRALESRQNKRPILSDLRESGSIEQDADNVMFIYRDEYYNKHSEAENTCEIIIGKQRNGPVGTINLYFGKPFMRFDSLSDIPGAF